MAQQKVNHFRQTSWTSLKLASIHHPWKSLLWYFFGVSCHWVCYHFSRIFGTFHNCSLVTRDTDSTGIHNRQRDGRTCFLVSSLLKDQSWWFPWQAYAKAVRYLYCPRHSWSFLFWSWQWKIYPPLFLHQIHPSLGALWSGSWSQKCHKTPTSSWKLPHSRI